MTSQNFFEKRLDEISLDVCDWAREIIRPMLEMYTICPKFSNQAKSSSNLDIQRWAFLEAKINSFQIEKETHFKSFHDERSKLRIQQSHVPLEES